MDEKKTCDSCRYFPEHFAKTEGGSFMPINCGHCICRDLKRNIAKKIVERRSDCEKWEPREIAIKERRESIIRHIEYMEEHLKQIVIVLQDDYDYINVKKKL